MNAHTEFQVIVGNDGRPAFVVIPYSRFRELQGRLVRGTVPNEVVNLAFDRDITPLAAWREHLGLTTAEIANRIGITEDAYSALEQERQPRKTKLVSAAEALGLDVDQLRW
jgi:DNA-binding XRE family transcriptional regulator